MTGNSKAWLSDKTPWAWRRVETGGAGSSGDGGRRASAAQEQDLRRTTRRAGRLADDDEVLPADDDEVLPAVHGGSIGSSPDDEDAAESFLP